MSSLLRNFALVVLRYFKVEQAVQKGTERRENRICKILKLRKVKRPINMSIVSALLERTLKGLHVYLSAPTQDCGKVILERELSAHLEIMSNALSVSQEF